ncbi:MAG TPA: winged helix DNA-binding domain-containing protein, partial [Methanocella sp.]|nr:winged helix DNA-binding domain-containing protein [Methanocella sp.]
AILGLLAHGGMTTQGIKKALGTEASIFLVLTMMCDSGLLVRGPPKGGWKSNLHTYHLLSEYYPGVAIKMDQAQATDSLVLRYLKAFGPASEDDIAWWTGLRRTAIRKALEGLGDRVSHVDVAETKKGLLIATADLKPLREGRPLSKPLVRLLPSLDPYLMGYKNRGRYLDPEFYGYIYDRSGNATTTVLVDGRLAGVWDVERNKNIVIKYFLFDAEDEAIVNEIGRQAVAMGGFLGDGPVRARVCDAMVPLPQRPPGAVMSPLKGQI